MARCVIRLSYDVQILIGGVRYVFNWIYRLDLFLTMYYTYSCLLVYYAYRLSLFVLHFGFMFADLRLVYHFALYMEIFCINVPLDKCIMNTLFIFRWLIVLTILIKLLIYVLIRILVSFQ